jgi:hypothetical protein
VLRRICHQTNLFVAALIVFFPGLLTGEVFGGDAPLGPLTGSQYVGIAKCALCHSRSEVRTEEAQFPEDLVSTDFVSLREVSRWATDKHAGAFAALNKGLGLKIIKTLGISSRDPSCVSCHGPIPNPKPGPELSLGVTCEACHGPGGGWLLAHSEPPWRAKSTREKQQLGMIDLRDPAVRARQCMSCHIGNPAEKKIVTHEMYAAGHPPLMSVEIEQQLSRMPSHWRNLSEKKPQIRSLFRFDANEKYRTKSVLLGGVLAYREWLNLLSAKSPSKSQHSWTDFTVYDCYSCHHDLKDSKAISWRQQRGFAGIAGQPHLAAWPQALVKLAIFHAAGGNPVTYAKKAREFSDTAERVSIAHNGKAFGGQKAAITASERDQVTNDLLAFLDRLVADIQSDRFDNAATIRLMQMLASEQKTLDYSSARQVAGALASLAQEAEFPNAIRAKIAKTVQELKNLMGLNLENRWQPAAVYDPQKFNNQLSRLAQLLRY